MNKAEAAFRVAVSCLGVEQVNVLLKRSGGTRQLKTVVLGAAVASALRQVIDSGEWRVLVDGWYFYDVEDFIRNRFGDILASAVSKLRADEVHVSCELSTFTPKDVIVISGEGVKDKIELSIERLVYMTLILALEDYMESNRVNINTLVIALDAVHLATKKTCMNAAKMAMIIQGGKKLQ
jgi:hypothetical protein